MAGLPKVKSKIAPRRRYVEAFVDGVKWWMFTTSGFSLFGEEREKAERGAEARYRHLRQYGRMEDRIREAERQQASSPSKPRRKKAPRRSKRNS